MADDIDLDLAWEFAPEGEFGFADLARDYFDAKAGVVQQAAALIPPVRRAALLPPRRQGPVQEGARGDGEGRAAGHRAQGASRRCRSRPGPQELVAGTCPAPIQDQIYKILFKPDKNGPEYKAVVEASKLAHKAPLDLLQGKPAPSPAPTSSTGSASCSRTSPRAWASLSPERAGDQGRVGAERRRSAFSIDDSQTTEIDDALSVQGLGTGTITFGVHIAAPGLAITPDSAVDKVARERLSTVYMPGWKITMLPDEVVQAYTLIEGRDCPAVSIYFTLDEATFEIKSK